MRLWLEGKSKYLKEPSKFDVYEMFSTSCGVLGLRRSEIPEYLDNDFWYGWQIWDRTRKLKTPPLDGGWMSWPMHVVDYLDAISSEYELYERERDADRFRTQLEFTAGRKLR